MGSETCDGCGRTINVSGGMSNLWTLERSQTTGMVLELDDETTYLLCFDCLEELPAEPTAADIEGLPSREQATATDPTNDRISAVLGGLIGGGIIGGLIGVVFSSPQLWMAIGLAVGVLGGLIVDRYRESTTD